MPASYALEELARRWHVPPWALTTAPPDVDPDDHLDWLIRGLEFQRMEASVKRG